ncbi:dihydrodipicolinate synthase family protein [Novosphingobium sp.]|jgi:4-hydroxy-tetrahydrodipicolinate synthase|uniref:dihydrodipicolinate synthase family protein n=1 Tax=Novosphingobium sp. TaxID=1874826 RepID=UPI002FDF9FDF
MTIFTGLSAFPPTPANEEGVVDTQALSVLVDRLAKAGVDSVSVLGSTGTYAYLDRDQRNRAVTAAVEAAAGRVPVVAGVGALRTSWSRDLAVAAERAGASGLLLAPMSYAKLSDREVADHFKAVAGATGLPLCIYNNPGTTNFEFSYDLIVELAQVPGIAAVKMPPRVDEGYAIEIRQLRERGPNGFKIGYSGDWCAAPAFLAGAEAWHSVVAGVLPEPAVRLTHAAMAGDADETARLQALCAPMWTLFEKHGGLRTVYGIAEILGLDVGKAPLPVQGYIGQDQLAGLAAAIDSMTSAARWFPDA